MKLLPADTPLYNHPLPQLEAWLVEQGCQQDTEILHRWHLITTTWTTTIDLEETTLRAEYAFDGKTRTLNFPYSLSRWDVEQAVFHADPQE